MRKCSVFLPISHGTSSISSFLWPCLLGIGFYLVFIIVLRDENYCLLLRKSQITILCVPTLLLMTEVLPSSYSFSPLLCPSYI